ncbi:MAG: hypothetical protein EOO45_00400 [Flavobacterium sp.]|nr:MAG: hypothetical protein EOO45_00400 [Flavobacterium sp.]
MMQEFSDQLFQRLKDGLLVISSERALPHIRLRDQFVLIRGMISELRGFVADHPFLEVAQEVHYHKAVLPRFKAQLIYHVELYNLQVGLPLGGAGLVLDYYRRFFAVCLEDVERFRFYYTYRKLGADELDVLYFTVSGDKQSALLPAVADMDECATAVGYLYAKFMAYELLYDFISAEVEKLVLAAADSGSAAGRPRFKWTGKTIDLIELAHGIHLENQIGNGEVGIVDFFAGLGDFFGVDLGIPKKGMDNLMDRKTMSRTRFTDRMRQSLHGKMDELEKYDPDRVLRKMRL